MAGIPEDLLPHEVTVDPYSGEGPYGAVYRAPVTVRCLVEDKRTRVLDHTGTQVIATSVIYMPLESDCPARSRVTLPDRQTTAVKVARHDGGGLPTPDHLEVSVT